jgi:hypothetical protein
MAIQVAFHFGLTGPKSSDVIAMAEALKVIRLKQIK